MIPVDICLLPLSLEAVEHVCTQEKSNAQCQCNKIASHKGKKGNKRPGTKSTGKVPKKACTKKHCNLCKKHVDACTMHNTKDCCRYKKDRTENNPTSAPPRKAERSQSHKAVFCTVKEEDGQAQEGDQEIRCQKEETLL
jgi:hypothetical protein